ncbi:glycoside hydrolase family 9 protein, partial [Balneolaceae bacterium]|nr:glycoside hydrolase family 9 protein [Balneolaceae bacterium]
THANFSSTIMPSKATNPRYVIQKGTAASLDFAAVMAQAARVYEPFDTNFATIALRAARDAYNWALVNPNVTYNQNEINSQFNPDIQTGTYSDGSFSDEFFWARAELYITTKDDKFYPDNGWNGVGNSGWSNVQALGLFSLVYHRKELSSIGLIDTSAMKNTLINAYEWYVNDSKTAPYRSPFGIESWQFNWGSNGGAGNLGMGILLAYQLTGEQKFYEGAIDIMDYLLGRNAVSYSYVTGFGDQSPMHIHHRQSAADNVIDPVPGWIAGGANPRNQNLDCGSNAYNSDLAALSYLDDYCSYSTNEITTYWNSPFVYLTAGIEVYTEDVFSDATSPIRFTAPSDDLTFAVGDTLPIAWSLNSVDEVDLFYKLYSSNEFTLLAEKLTINSFENFVIPNLPGDSLLFKLQETSDSTIYALSNIVNIKKPKSIKSVSASRRFNLPFRPGSNVTISWALVEIDSLDIFYYLSSDSELISIVEAYPAVESQYGGFEIPESSGDSIYFRIIDSESQDFFLDSPGYEITISVGIEEQNKLGEFTLDQNYPNPFNPKTQINFSLARDQHVTVEVFDINGRAIAKLIDKPMQVGEYRIGFDASGLSSGVYLYKLTTPSFTETKKMLLIK